MSSWFHQHRVEWILEIVKIYGFINREHIEKKFDVSTPQASIDLQRACKRDPRFVYNKSSKRYEYE